MKGREFHEGKDAMKGPLWSVTEQAVGFLLEWVQVSYWNGFRFPTGMGSGFLLEWVQVSYWNGFRFPTKMGSGFLLEWVQVSYWNGFRFPTGMGSLFSYLEYLLFNNYHDNLL